MAGSLRVSDSRASLLSAAHRTNVAAVHVADRAAPSNNDISPTRLPGPRTTSVSGVIRLTMTVSTVTSPSMINSMYPVSSRSPSWKMTVPSGMMSGCMYLMTICACSSVKVMSAVVARSISAAVSALVFGSRKSSFQLACWSWFNPVTVRILSIRFLSMSILAAVLCQAAAIRPYCHAWLVDSDHSVETRCLQLGMLGLMEKKLGRI